MYMTALRVFYAKTGRAKYISHLDVMRSVTRALRRSRLPLWYTEGFNPHLYITFALPLPLGCEGLRESFDVRLTADIPPCDAAARMREVMPSGFEITGAALPVMEPGEIVWADYDIRLLYTPECFYDGKRLFSAFCAQTVINTQKKTKKGMQEIDIRPHINILSEEWSPERLTLKLRAAAGIRLNINPTLFLKAFYAYSDREPDGVRTVRTAILNGKYDEFR